jgi:hypothetical protein
MTTLIWMVVVVVAFAAGILVGRANPKKADKLAEIADNLKESAKTKIKNAKS